MGLFCIHISYLAECPPQNVKHVQREAGQPQPSSVPFSVAVFSLAAACIEAMLCCLRVGGEPVAGQGVFRTPVGSRGTAPVYPGRCGQPGSRGSG